MAEVEDPPVLMEGAADRILNDSLLVASGLKGIL